MYLPRMSVSMLSLSPTFFDLKLVTLIVCGIKQTDARSFFASTTVKLIPSSAIEPFLTTYFVSFFGILNQNLLPLVFFQSLLLLLLHLYVLKQSDLLIYHQLLNFVQC